ncbi:helix-turn-helix domain-containing protein [Oerskovia enterophila]|uniref:Transcriptional activator FtrA n=1 Tax=Oerskovia enterophila TaxID=43678 RepID=A0A163PZ01_9CELL|nr:helix-turn-helix domain-containing protein [Oerskovia enterophila]KZM33651.1 transcriptional activator FtrA [Oerskovia enterophila]
MTFVELGRAVARTNALRFLGHPPHVHDEPHLVYVIAGRGTLAVEGHDILLQVGQSAWIPAGVEHGLTLAEDSMVIGPILSPDADPPGGRIRVLGASPALAELVMVVLCAAPETDEERLPFRAAFEDVLRSITQEYFPLTFPEHPAAHAIAVEAASFDGTLEALAERQFLSVRHVQRLFVEETGLTFARWRTKARLNRSIVSLRNGESVHQAVHAAGFTTRHGLLKALSRECGIPLERLMTDPHGELAVREPAA